MGQVRHYAVWVTRRSRLHHGFLYEDFHCLLVSWLILLCKIRKLNGAPKRTMRYLRRPSPPHCRTREFCRTRCLRSILSIWQLGTDGNWSYGTVRLAKWKSWYKCRFRFFFFYRMVNPYGKFSEPGFPHNFAKKNDRHDLKIGCTNASRRQLQSVLKIGV